MPIIKEFKEFFLRAIKVPSGTKADKEANYPTKYQVTDVNGNQIMAFNRFLKEHFPSEDVFKKLLESITFKLNPEDTATQTTQGIVKIITGVNIVNRTNFVTDAVGNYTTVVVPSALPVVKAGSNTTVDIEIVRAIDNVVVLSIPPGDTQIYYVRYVINALGAPASIVNLIDNEEVKNAGLVSGSADVYSLATFPVPANSMLAQGSYLEVDVLWYRYTGDNTYLGTIQFNFGTDIDELLNQAIESYLQAGPIVDTGGLWRFNAKVYNIGTNNIQAICCYELFLGAAEGTYIPSGFGTSTRIDGAEASHRTAITTVRSIGSPKINWTIEQKFSINYKITNGTNTNYSERCSAFFKIHN